MIAFTAAALVMTAQAPATRPDVGYDELMRGRDAAALAAIAKEEALETRDPARLINLGIAHARQGEAEQARAMFEAAIASPDRVELETATGKWIDSRWLARKALAMLEDGALERGERVAAR